MATDVRDVQGRLHFYDLHENIEAPFKDIAKAVERHAPAALDAFYDKAAATPAAAAHFSSTQMMKQASAKQLNHWRQLFGGPIDGNHHQRATRIGEIHGRIKLDPTLYFGAYAQILGNLIEAMIGSSPMGRLPGSRRLARSISVLVRTALFDMDVSVSTIFQIREDEQRAVIEKIGKALNEVAVGNLATELPQLPDAYAQLNQDFAAALSGLTDALSSVAHASEAIRTGSAEISIASDDLARRTEQQAASLEETAAAMDQVSSAVRDIAREASDVNRAVQATRGDAEQGGQIVRQAVEAMKGIETSSREIASIVNMIDGISFQTNLLALNAGVEAARAGDAGKGFAVVANEVRALAQRAADAAKSIKELITLSWHQVESGVQLVAKSGEAFDQIEGRVAQISPLIANIAQASGEQAHGVQQVNIVVSDMDKMTQQNAAMVEQSTAASRSLASEADVLAQLVHRFELGDGAAKPAARSGKRASAGRMPPVRGRSIGNLALAEPLENDWADF